MADAGTSLVERLGYAPSDRLIIVNCDDLGSSHTANLASLEAFERGIATSGTLMVPCPWAREAVELFAGHDLAPAASRVRPGRPPDADRGISHLPLAFAHRRRLATR